MTIAAADGQIVGCGFLVADRQVITCAHVVNAAVGARPDEREQPGQSIWVEFAVIATGLRIAATVESWVPIESDATGDIALLRLSDAPPARAQPAYLAPAADMWDHTFRTYGFPRGYPGGLWASGRILGRQRHGWVQLEDVKSAGAAVERGFSGAAVYDESLEAVVGMVVAQDTHETRKIAFMLPADILMTMMPAMSATIAVPDVVLGPLSNVPRMPSRFAPRVDEIERVGRAVLDAVDRPVDGGRMVAVVGMGGAGKSVLAAAVSRTEGIRRAFSDGVVWIELGPDPSIVERQVQLAAALGAPDASFADPQQGKTFLGRLLAQQHCLVVLDNIWRVEHLAAFDALGPHGRLLLTTRDVGLARAAGATRCEVGLLDDVQALALLAQWAGQEVEALPAVARLVARECGNLALALAMAGAMIEGRPERWSGVLRRLQAADLDKIRQSFPSYPHPDLLRAIDVSVAALAPHERHRYLELATFEGRAAPRGVIELVWEPAGLDDLDTDELLHLFVDRSLARLDADGRLYLHDLQMDYVRHHATDAARLHSDLVEAYRRRSPAGWSSGPADGYYFENLAHHLAQAGRAEELQMLLLDLDWLSAKLSATDVAGLLADFDSLAASAAESGDGSAVNEVRSAIRLAGHIVAREPSQLRAQLVGRLADSPSPPIQHLVARAREWTGATWLCPAAASLILPGGPLLSTLVGHTGWLRALVIPQDNRTVISGANDGTVRVWDIEDGTERLTLRGHDGAVWSLALTPDDQTVVSGATDGTVRIWRTRDGAQQHVLREHEGSVWSVAVTPNGRLAISGSSDGTARVWDLATGTQRHVLRGHHGTVNRVAAPNDEIAVSRSEDGTVRVWSLADGRELHLMESGEHGVQSTGLAVTARHVLLSSDGGPVYAWDLQDGTLVHFLTRAGIRDWTVAATADGTRAVTGSFTGQVTVWDLERGTPLQTLTGHSGWVDVLTMTPSGQLISGANDAMVRIWDIHLGQEIAALRGHTGWVLAAAVTHDGRRVISGAGDATIRIWDLENIASRPAQQSHSGWVSAVAFVPSEDQKWAVSASDDATVRVWNVQTGEQLLVLRGHSAEVTSLAVARDGTHVVSGSRDGTIRRWRVRDGMQVNVWTVDGAVTSVALASGDQVVAGGTDQGEILLGEVDAEAKARVLRTGEAIVVLSATPDGRQVLAGGDQGTLSLWEVVTGENLFVFRGSGGPVLSIAISTNGTRAFSGCIDGRLTGWDLRSGEELWERQAHDLLAYTTQVLPGSDERVISGGGDGVVRIWNMETGAEMRALVSGHDAVRVIAVSPDGSRLISGAGESAVLWDVGAGVEIARFTSDGAMVAAVIDDDCQLICGDSTGGVHALRVVAG